METVIWLHDVRKARDKVDLLGFDASGAVSPKMFDEQWPRYVVKMATGAGKTKVLSLLIAWSYFHKLYGPTRPPSRNFLLIAPNIIVLDRLRADCDGLKIFFGDPVLPDNGYNGHNWRDDFQITLHIQDEVRAHPPTGNIFLTNIHRAFLGDIRELCGHTMEAGGGGGRGAGGGAAEGGGGVEGGGSTKARLNRPRVYDGRDMQGPLHRFFDADHRRLDAILNRACLDPDRVDVVVFQEFRAGLLKHIGMEEKVLFLAASRARRDRLPLFAKLRVDHGAIASLLVPTPNPAIVAELVSILGPHNRREEEDRGIYDVCDEAVGPEEAERLLEELRHFPEIRLKGHNDAPVVHEHIRVNVDLSRAQWRDNAIS